MNTPYVWCHSEIGVDGREYIAVMIKEPAVNAHDLYEGGQYLHFDVDYKKEKTECSSFHFRNGVPQWDKDIKTWKEEVWWENQCLKFAEDYMKEQEAKIA